MKKTLIAVALAAVCGSANAIDLTFWQGGALVGTQSGAASQSNSAMLTAGDGAGINGNAGSAFSRGYGEAELGSDGIVVDSEQYAASINLGGAFTTGNVLSAEIGQSGAGGDSGAVGAWQGVGVGLSPTSP